MPEFLPQWLQHSPQYLIAVIPTLAFMEGCIGIGLFVSGVFLLTTCTFLYTRELIDIYAIAALAFTGAMMGDHVGYFAGHWLGPKLKHASFFSRHQQTFEKAEDLYQRSAIIAVCFGRLFPAIRSITPALAAISGVPPRHFLAYDLLACSIWTGGLMLLVMGLDLGLSG